MIRTLDDGVGDAAHRGATARRLSTYTSARRLNTKATATKVSRMLMAFYLVWTPSVKTLTAAPEDLEVPVILSAETTAAATHRPYCRVVPI